MSECPSAYHGTDEDPYDHDAERRLSDPDAMDVPPEGWW